MNKEEIDKALTSSGIRVTKLRTLVLECFVDKAKPVNAPEILKAVKKQVKSANKTTIYRCLDLLLEHEIISMVHIDPRIVHYELSNLPHHHHATCGKCGDIQEVASEAVEDAVTNLEHSIARSGFFVDSHVLEFRGLCTNCK